MSLITIFLMKKFDFFGFYKAFLDFLLNFLIQHQTIQKTSTLCSAKVLSQEDSKFVDPFL
jgi:hypothetical protein